MATTPNYSPDYEDERFTTITDEKNAALTESEQTYGEMIAGADKFYNDLKETTEQWKDTQTDIQNQQTDFTIQQIEQQKAQTQKDYEKEQAGAYVDWQKQSNEYGVNAEKMASAGLANTGYSESSQVSMYNTYQNRIATARESFQRSWDNFANKITEARLQNSAALAEIALTAFEKQAEYSLQAFQYKNQLILDLQDKKLELQRFYADQWQRELDQVNVEANRQFQADQAEIERQWKEKEAELDRQFQAEQDKLEMEFKKAQAELDRKHDLALVEANTKAAKEKADHEHKLAMQELEKQYEYQKKLKADELANAKELAKYQHDLENQGTTFSKGSGGVMSAAKNAVKSAAKTSKKTSKKTSSTGSGNVFKDANANIQIANIKTYEQAVAFAKKLGATFGAMTMSEWSRRRNAGSKGTEAKYKSYEAYIRDYCRYLYEKYK